MARHKVGDSYLSDEEYEGYVSDNWKVWLFLIGGGVTGLASYIFTSDADLSKPLRFIFVILSFFSVGCALAKFSAAIRTLTAITVVGGLLFFVGSLVWDSL